MSKNLLAAIKKLLGDIVLLQNKAVAAGIVALIVSVLPGVHLDGTLLATILVAVGTVASFVESLFIPTKVTPVIVPVKGP